MVHSGVDGLPKQTRVGNETKGAKTKRVPTKVRKALKHLNVPEHVCVSTVYTVLPIVPK